MWKRSTALIVALALVVTPALVRAASICRCADHAEAHAAPKAKPSCCHGQDARPTTPEPEPIDAGCRSVAADGACCEGGWSELLRGPVTFELRYAPLDPPAVSALPPQLGQTPRGCCAQTNPTFHTPLRASPILHLHCALLI